MAEMDCKDTRDSVLRGRNALELGLVDPLVGGGGGLGDSKSLAKGSDLLAQCIVRRLQGGMGGADIKDLRLDCIHAL